MLRSLAIAFFLTCLAVWPGNPLFPMESSAATRRLLSTLGALVAPIDRQQEVYLGAQLDKKVREKYPASQNVALQHYVIQIGKKIAAKTYKNYPYTYIVLEEPRVANAFASPGGFMYITTGMINLLESESQLAAVLAHETAHVMQRHVVKKLQEQQAVNTGVFLLSQVFGKELDNRLTAMGEFVLFQRFSREDEYDADVQGTQLMVRAGYNPNGMLQLLKKLNALESRGVPLSFLQSHPGSEAPNPCGGSVYSAKQLNPFRADPRHGLLSSSCSLMGYLCKLCKFPGSSTCSLCCLQLNLL